MAQVIQQPITLGGGHTVGSISVNGGAVRGEGGPIRPRLIVPVKFEMNPMGENAMIAVTSLTASLGTDAYPSPANEICQQVSLQLASGFPVKSQTYANNHTVDVRFSMRAAEVEDIETRRHASSSDVFTLHLGLDVVVSALRSHNGTATGQTEWNSHAGMYAEVFPFWTTQVQPVQINIEQSTWVNNVLPGLGYDRLRLIELEFPPQLPNHDNAARQFDSAMRALNERRYGDCIDKCRGLLNMWEKQYGATMNRRVADVISDERGWLENDIRRQMLDQLWKKVGDVANAPHHPEGDVNTESFERRDARLILLLAAALSEYVS